MSRRRYLLDTNVIVDALRGDPVAEQIYSHQDMYLSTIVRGELYYGAYYAVQPQPQLDNLAVIFSLLQHVPNSKMVAKRYGEQKATLRKLGTPIPDNDLWIAATALEHDMILVTNDTHFNNVKELQLRNWKQKSF